MTSDSASQQAKEAKILDLFDCYPSATPSADTLRAYLAAVDEFSVEAVTRSVKQFSSGLVERDDRSFVPSAEDLTRNVRQWQEALDMRAQSSAEAKIISYRPGEPIPVGYSPHGGTVDFGRGSISLVGLTAAEQDRVLALKGVTPDGETMAHMSVDAIKAVLGGAQIEDKARVVVPVVRGFQ